MYRSNFYIHTKKYNYRIYTSKHIQQAIDISYMQEYFYLLLAYADNFKCEKSKLKDENRRLY